MFGKKFMGGAALTALTLAMATPPAIAQETTAVLRGDVFGSNGGPIAGATVTVTHEPTGTKSTEQAEGGQFNFRGLRVGGPYTIEVTAPGFKPSKEEGVFLTVGDPYLVDFELVGVNEEIVVTARRPVGAAITGSGTRLGADAIEGVVSVNRDIRDLARRDPLASQNARGDGGISIAGSNPRTNRITIDGVQAQDDFGLNTGGFPTRRGPISLDAIEQFAVEAVPFDVENGDFLGGGLNIVLAGGSNEFDGSAFIKYQNEGMVGTRLQGLPVKALISQDNYSATLRGPIIPDTLFFALAYENYESFDPTTTGPAGQGFASTIVGPTGAAMTQANIDAVTNVFRNVYNSTYNFGSIALTKPITDEKYSARFDWNINDDHRASFTYRVAESGLIQRTNLGTTSAGLDSQWYLTGEEDTGYTYQINSNWTDRLTTEFRYSKRDYVRLQEPPSGQEFADIRVCSTATNLDAIGQAQPLLNCRNGATAVGVVRWGPDQFRHANKLETNNTQIQFSAEYELGDHLIKAGYQDQQQEVFNLFVPNSDGTYYFDSIADFQAGLANQLVYRNALTGNANDAAARFTYNVRSLFAQDTWDVTDALTLSYGVRYDAYTDEGGPALNPNFTARNPGQRNTETYNDRDIVMPRFSFNWDPSEKLRLSGGLGLFSGGLPDVFISNVYSNTGILDNTIQIERVAGGTFVETTGSTGFTQAIGAAALNVGVNPNFGRASNFPAAVQNFLAGGGAPIAAETNVIAKDFEIPSDWKANISIKYDVWDDWRLTFDGVYVKGKDGLAFRDIRVRPLIVNGAQALTPDGRIRYDGLSTAQRTSIVGTTVQAVPSNIPTAANGAPGSNRDIQAYNPSQDSEAWTLAFGAGKEWDNGFSVNFVYTLQEVEDFSSSARFSSTASSLYGGQFASFDPNTAVKGKGQEEVEDAFKLGVGFRHNFFGELETRFDLFGEQRAGRPSTFTMNAGGGRNATFGVNRGAQLAYIPNMSGTVSQISPGGAWTVSSDSRVAFDTLATADNLRSMINRFSIPQGGIVPRSSYQNERVSQFDLAISQELPTFFQGHRTLFTMEIQNVANLVNDEWGIIEEFPEDFRLYDVSCAGADGVADNDGVLSCNRYRISSINTNQGEPRNTERSRWAVVFGLKYEF
jgi:outer membrane receptor protein involved in Fe transport